MPLIPKGTPTSQTAIDNGSTFKGENWRTTFGGGDTSGLLNATPSVASAVGCFAVPPCECSSRLLALALSVHASMEGWTVGADVCLPLWPFTTVLVSACKDTGTLLPQSRECVQFAGAFACVDSSISLSASGLAVESTSSDEPEEEQDNLGLKVGQGNNMRRRMPSNLADSSPTTNIMLEADGRSVERTEECDNEEWSCAPPRRRVSGGIHLMPRRDTRSDVRMCDVSLYRMN
ncbi:hypothetical protein TcWFU_008150 [Taenia crassiceps]|uniref:Uncharacterized protein n=1 Tax=Taenia crassiceps TaxID=6207 RepID=A0ABR4QBN7_9CEST